METVQSGLGTQSLRRALVLLNVIGVMGQERPQGVALSDLSRVTGLPKPSVHRVLTALVETGYVERTADSGHYRLGMQARILGDMAGRAPEPLLDPCRDSLARLADLSEDTVFLTVRKGSFSVCVLREDGGGQIRNYALAVGDRHPLGIGAGSLAILSALAPEESDRELSANAEILARHYPLIDVESLRNIVRRTRQEGYALNEGLVAPGSWAIGMEVRDKHRQPVAALSIATIEPRLLEPRRLDLVAAMRREVTRIETVLHSQGESDEHIH